MGYLWVQQEYASEYQLQGSSDGREICLSSLLMASKRQVVHSLWERECWIRWALV